MKLVPSITKVKPEDYCFATSFRVPTFISNYKSKIWYLQLYQSESPQSFLKEYEGGRKEKRAMEGKTEGNTIYHFSA